MFHFAVDQNLPGKHLRVFPLLPLFCGGSSLHNSRRRRRRKKRRADKTTAAEKRLEHLTLLQAGRSLFMPSQKGIFLVSNSFFFANVKRVYRMCFFLPPLSCQTFAAAAAAFLLCVGHSAPHIVGAQVYSRIRPHALLEKEREKT